MKHLLQRGSLATDSEDEKVKKSSLLVMAIPFSMAGLLWGALYFANGLYLPGWIPFSYGILSIISIIHFIRFKRFGFFRFSQILLILLLPFFLQVTLGGFIPGSAVIIWALLSPIGALAFYSVRVSLFWFAAFVLLVAIAFCIDHLLPHWFSWNLPDVFITRMLLMNVIGLSCTVYLLKYYFVGQQIGLKQAVELKSEEIELKNKEITDSINYAKRIQYALLAHEEVLQESLGEHFVLFKPKDIVSGDFYWATRREGNFYLAVCDSTGHGVPGAFMSLLNTSFLNEAITAQDIRQPSAICNYVRGKLIEHISQSGAQDGMDGALFCFNGNEHTITYAAAHNAPFLVSGGKGLELHADKMPIGKGERQAPFTQHALKAESGSMLYLYTDGYADQFGGPGGKKFKYRQLQELLISIHHLPAAQQKTLLNDRIEAWKGSLEQTDDILLVGIRL